MVTVFGRSTFPATVNLNVADARPLGTTTGLGTGTVTRSLVERITLMAAGAGIVRVTVPVMLSPVFALDWLSDSEVTELAFHINYLILRGQDEEVLRRSSPILDGRRQARHGPSEGSRSCEIR